jgi:hypothetical protein
MLWAKIHWPECNPHSDHRDYQQPEKRSLLLKPFQPKDIQENRKSKRHGVKGKLVHSLGFLANDEAWHPLPEAPLRFWLRLLATL